MAGRGQLASRVCESAGAAIARVLNPADGWPALLEVKTGDSWRRVAAFVAPIGQSHRNRDLVERRFQNPGSDRPMVSPDGFMPMFLGVWESDQLLDVDHPVLVSANVAERASNVTRFSVFPKVQGLTAAAKVGWSDTYTTSDEHLTYLWPELLDVAVEAAAQNVTIPEETMSAAAATAGVLEQDGTDPVERLRRLGRTLVRDARFRKTVLVAYDHSCAMCGLGLGLVEAAHILPVAAPGAPDSVSNGVALCRNHHGAFDRSLIWVHPSLRTITFHPTVHANAITAPSVYAFVTGSHLRLTLPISGSEPAEQMFLSRYAFMSEQYGWTQ